MDILSIQTLSIYDPFIICNNSFWLYIWLTLPWARNSAVHIVVYLWVFRVYVHVLLQKYCLHNYNFIN